MGTREINCSKTYKLSKNNLDFTFEKDQLTNTIYFSYYIIKEKE